MNYGHKYDPPIDAISLPYRAMSRPIAPVRHVVVGYSRRGHGAFVERVEYKNRDGGYDTTFLSRLYHHDEAAEAELTALAAQLDAAYAEHIAPLLAKVEEIRAGLTPLAKPGKETA